IDPRRRGEATVMASFKGHSWDEGGEGATHFPIWGRKGRLAVLDVPGANGDVIQKMGRKSDTLAVLATCTQSEPDALYGDVGTSGSLVFSYDTRTAVLDSIDGPHEVLTSGRFVVTLNFLG